MEQQVPSGNSPQGNHEPGALDGSLQALWDRVRQAAETIVRLRDENRTLRGRVGEQERQLQQLGQEFRDLQEQLKTQPPQTLPQHMSTTPFDNGEREVLVTRVKEMLAKLDAYL